MKAQLFTLDVAFALFFLVSILASQSALHSVQSNAIDLETKQVAQDALNAMEKTGYLRDVGDGGENAAEVRDYLNEMLPATMAANFSLRVYRYSSDFTLHRTVNTSTGSFSNSFSLTKRVDFNPKKNSDEYIITELWVGYR